MEVTFAILKNFADNKPPIKNKLVQSNQNKRYTFPPAEKIAKYPDTIVPINKTSVDEQI
jgi:hypothetical protein